MFVCVSERVRVRAHVCLCAFHRFGEGVGGRRGGGGEWRDLFE